MTEFPIGAIYTVAGIEALIAEAKANGPLKVYVVRNREVVPQHLVYERWVNKESKIEQFGGEGYFRILYSDDKNGLSFNWVSFNRGFFFIFDNYWHVMAYLKKKIRKATA